MAVLIFLSFCESLKDGFKPMLIQRAVDAVAPAMNQETVRKRAWTEKLLFLSPTSKNMRISDLLVCRERQKPWPDVDQSPGRKYELTNHISKSKSEISFYFYWPPIWKKDGLEQWPYKWNFSYGGFHSHICILYDVGNHHAHGWCWPSTAAIFPWQIHWPFDSFSDWLDMLNNYHLLHRHSIGTKWTIVT